ncbi:MAG: hypothetical protein Q9184_007240 [Pyrenodesmia sp. 2 TL-2023]
MRIGLAYLTVLLLSLGIQLRVLKTPAIEDAFRRKAEITASSYEGITSPSNHRSEKSANDACTVIGTSLTERKVQYLNPVPKSSDHPLPLTQPPNNDGAKAITARNISLQPRFDPFSNLLHGYRMTWDHFESITPSIYGADALATLFSKLLELVRDHSLHQPSLSSFQVKYGPLRLLVTSADRPFSWDLVTEMAENLLAKVKRGLLGFFQVGFREYVNGVAMGVGVALVGIQVLMAGFPAAVEGDGYVNNIVG